TVETLLLHVQTMLDALELLERHGVCFGERSIKVFATAAKQRLAERLVHQLGAMAELHPLEHPYYSGGLRFQIWVRPTQGPAVPLFDGVAFEWVVRMPSGRRAFSAATGTGAQLLALRFRSTQAAE